MRVECLVEDCVRESHGGGLCLMHYKRQRRSGRLELRTVEDRFWEKVDKSEPYGCWPWIGFINPKTGYGQFPYAHRTLKLAHRVSYEWAKGAIPPKMNVDHLCRNRACVNPAHLEVVTYRENLMRGETHAARNVAKTSCPQGHPYDAANTYVTSNGFRQCRICKTENIRILRARRSK